ncbi:MAG: YraN family protein [Anaerolineales bacterium]
MSKHRQEIGQWGEGVAARYLEANGYNVVARNVRTPYGEIDIVAEKDGFISFVEVKTRTTSRFGPPEISVTPRKQEHMLAAAEHHAQENEIDHWQIDVIAVEGRPGKQPVFTHFENAI